MTAPLNTFRERRVSFFDKIALLQSGGPRIIIVGRNPPLSTTIQEQIQKLKQSAFFFSSNEPNRLYGFNRRPDVRLKKTKIWRECLIWFVLVFLLFFFIIIVNVVESLSNM